MGKVTYDTVVWRKKYFNSLIIGVLLIVIFSLPAFSSGKADIVLQKDTLICGFLGWGDLYASLVKTLKDIDQPQHKEKKAFLDSLVKIYGPQLSRARKSPAWKNCKLNRRVLLGAMEMYNMDNTNMLDHLDMEKLVKGKYLKKPVSCEEGGTYSYLIKGWKVVCSKHPDNEKEGEEPPPTPITLSEQIQKIMQFHESGALIPKGCIWIGVENDYTYRLAFEGSFKPQKTYEFLKDLKLFSFSDLSLDDNQTSFKAIMKEPFLAELQISISPDLVQIGTDFEADSVSTRWEKFLACSKGKNAFFGLELDMGKLLELGIKIVQQEDLEICHMNIRSLQMAMRMFNQFHKNKMQQLDIPSLQKANFIKFPPVCPHGGTYQTSTRDSKVQCSIHGSTEKPASGESVISLGLPDQRMRSISRVRLLWNHDNVELSAQIPDSKTRATLKETVQTEMKNIELESYAKKIPGSGSGILKKLTDQKKAFETEEWIGISYPDAGADSWLDSIMEVPHE